MDRGVRMWVLHHHGIYMHSPQPAILLDDCHEAGIGRGRRRVWEILGAPEKPWEPLETHERP